MHYIIVTMYHSDLRDDVLDFKLTNKQFLWADRIADRLFILRLFQEQEYNQSKGKQLGLSVLEWFNIGMQHGMS